MFLKISQYSQENTCVRVSLFIKNRLQHSCFLVNIAKFWRASIMKNICERLLMKGLFPLKCKRWFTQFFFRSNLFSTEPLCCLTFSWIELQMFLRCCSIQITITSLYWDTFFIFSIFVSMSRPRSVYVASWSIFHFQPHFHCH